VKYVYIIVIGVCIDFIAERFHWPFAVALTSMLMIITVAFLVARLVDEDRQ
jgi:ABC-type spermidine/putrescine transport system permease subunit I